VNFLKSCASLVVILSVLSCNVAFAQTQADINSQACAGYKNADSELNKVYKSIITEYKKDAVFIEKMKVAQRAWLVYRDAHVDSIYPEKDKSLHYGSVYPTCQCGVMEKMTIERTKWLKQWASGIAEGDVCSGSIKTK